MTDTHFNDCCHDFDIGTCTFDADYSITHAHHTQDLAEVAQTTAAYIPSAVDHLQELEEFIDASISEYPMQYDPRNREVSLDLASWCIDLMRACRSFL